MLADLQDLTHLFEVAANARFLLTLQPLITYHL